VSVARIRTLVLLGQGDEGAAKSFAVLNVLSNVMVALSNVPLLLCQESVSAVVSNDPVVRAWFQGMLWVRCC
jgi:hypothetical protein